MNFRYLSAEKTKESAEKVELAAENKNQTEVVDNFLRLVRESMVLKLHIAKLTNRQPDVSKFELYGKILHFKI